MIHVRRWFASATNRPLIVAAAIGFVVRACWAVWATNDPGAEFNDAWAYAAMAERFASFGTPVLGGAHTAFFPPGFPLVAAPVVWIGRETGLWDAYVAGAIVNVAVSTLSILLVGVLARRWFGQTAGSIASWLLALSPAHVYYSSSNLSEPLLTALVLTVMAASWAVLEHEDRSRRGPLLLGAAVGCAVLVKSSGIVLLVVPALTALAVSTPWRRVVRLTAWTLVGAVALTAPWAVRNGVQVGVWTPLSTNNAAFACNGNRDGATGGWDTSSAADADCFRGSPFDDPDIGVDTPLRSDPSAAPADEPEWYGRTTRTALAWIVAHPVETVRLLPQKAWRTYGSPGAALEDGRNLVTDSFGGPAATSALTSLAAAWHALVLSLAALGLLLGGACRRAFPLWGYAAALTLVVFGGIGLSRYSHSITAVATVVAAAVIAAAAGRAEPFGRRTTGTTPDETQDRDPTGPTAPGEPVDRVAG